jgi:type IV pilus assembly protein PilV
MDLTHPAKGTQQGSVLLEALIAFLIFSMGILGVIGLQATSITNTMEARYRTDAAFLANQIIAQMWVDPWVGPNANGFQVKAPDPTYGCNPCTSANGNTNTQAWVTQIQSGFLPGGSNGTANQPSISVTDSTGASCSANQVACAQVTVTMNWMSPKTGAVAHSYVTQTQIQFNN